MSFTITSLAQIKQDTVLCSFTFVFPVYGHNLLHSSLSVFLSMTDKSMLFWLEQLTVNHEITWMNKGL